MQEKKNMTRPKLQGKSSLYRVTTLKYITIDQQKSHPKKKTTFSFASGGIPDLVIYNQQIHLHLLARCIRTHQMTNRKHKPMTKN